jgi:prepilin-type N-terminal cleavage/methylation domain-containing protein
MRKAFTLIELLVVIAIIAILAAILFPVFAQAKSAAKVTASISGMKQMALGLQMYSTDFDDMTTFEYGYAENPASSTNQYHSNTTWVGRILPYVKNQSIFFDKVIGEISDYNALNDDPYYTDPFYTYAWSWVTTFSMNTNGYSRATGGRDCNGVNTSFGSLGQVRSLTAIENPSARLALTPTRYGSISNWSWMRFLTVQASWPVYDRYADGFSWFQLVADARRQYGSRHIGAFADGSARKFGPEKFVKYYAGNTAQSEANTMAEWCVQMNNRNLFEFWGSPWSAN